MNGPLRFGLGLLLELLGGKSALSKGVIELINCKHRANDGHFCHSKRRKPNTEERREESCEAGGERSK